MTVVAADSPGEATRNPQEARPGSILAPPAGRRLTAVREASGVWTSRVTAERFRAADIEEAVRAGALQPLLPARAVLWGKERRIAESCARATRAEMVAAGVDSFGIVETEHNLEVYQGLNNMLRLLIGAAVSTGGANYANGTARLCVGDGAGSVPTAAVTDTDLAALTGASHRYMNACDSSFPSVPSGGNNLASSKLTAQATIATGNGNFVWNEVGLDSGGASGTGAASGLFNHIGSNILTKTSAAAVALTLVVTQS